MARVIFWDVANGLPEGEPLIRWDLAWPLFLQGIEPGELPLEQPPLLNILGRWFWEQMGMLGGRLRPDAHETVWFVTPALSDGAREYLTRLASFWCDEVYWEVPTAITPNRWTIPAVNVGALPSTPLWTALTESYPEGIDRHLLPMIGVGRVFIKVQQVVEGSASARLHSHSAQDEYYFILAGSGTLRMGRYSQPVAPGTFIAKPTGPDLTSQIVADRGESVTILDIEVHADSRLAMGGRDMMAYTDHQEVLLVGAGMEGMVPQSAVRPTEDVFSHYFDGYVRAVDGSVIPCELPGHPKRDDG
ncbi:cupin domain-containing protein [Sulfobacillus harzensis]|uniref:Cupin domain-containing protein n=1 Tax=Sulfobacillus harzensis TaxID=2729629 RepID=A0A7Y0L4I8_9FIRM|nr:cupin domain-containing protein [Sulfobacillus harzensis]NMP22822.1 cupin domain-containing protein [Sulfobacillus harzensis]